MQSMRKQNPKQSSWAGAYNLAFTTPEDKLSKNMEIYKEAIKAGVDKQQALLFGRTEAFTLAAVAQFSHDAQQSTIATTLQLQNALNDRTSYLGREIGRLWQAQGQGGVGTALWNLAAGSAIGRGLGLNPIVTTVAPAAPFNPVPQGSSDPHADVAHPPTVVIASGLAANFNLTIDSTVTNCDRTGCIKLTNKSGATQSVSPGIDLFTLTYHTVYAERPIVTAYVESDASSGTAGLVGYCSAKSGGTATGFTIQSLTASSGSLPIGGTISIRYSVRASTSSGQDVAGGVGF